MKSRRLSVTTRAVHDRTVSLPRSTWIAFGVCATNLDESIWPARTERKAERRLPGTRVLSPRHRPPLLTLSRALQPTYPSRVRAPTVEFTARAPMQASRVVVPGAARVRVRYGNDATWSKSSTRPNRRASSRSSRRGAVSRAASEPRVVLGTEVTRARDDTDVVTTQTPHRFVRTAVTAVAAAAVALSAQFGAPDYAFAATPAPTTTADASSWGNSLLERRRVEETAARANLDSVLNDIRKEESQLKELRFTREAERVREINEIRVLEEQKARAQVANGNTLCVTPFGVDVVGISQTVALVGAIGAGLTSNARKAEIAELNEKMRLVNSTLRAQIRAPSPSGVYQDGGVAVPRGVTHTATNKSSGGPMDSMDLEEEAAAALRNSDDDDDESPSSAELLGALREGRALLKEDTVVAYNKALVSFEKALTLARMVGNSTQTRRATRGLAASRRGLGDGKAAIAHLKEVLLMRQTVGDAAGDTDALGAIADIYTEIGDLENAGRYYDLYLDALNREMM